MSSKGKGANPAKHDALEFQLKEINKKMENVLTKNDTFLKDMIKTTLDQMKDDLLKSVFHRIELLEVKLFEKEKENDLLKSKLTDLEKNMKTQKDENEKMKKR